MDNSLARAEAYRDQLHDLPDYDVAQQCAIDALAAELCEREFDRRDKESMRAEWVNANWERFVPAAIVWGSSNENVRHAVRGGSSHP